MENPIYIISIKVKETVYLFKDSLHDKLYVFWESYADAERTAKAIRERLPEATVAIHETEDLREELKKIGMYSTISNPTEELIHKRGTYKVFSLGKEREWVTNWHEEKVFNS